MLKLKGTHGSSTGPVGDFLALLETGVLSESSQIIFPLNKFQAGQESKAAVGKLS